MERGAEGGRLIGVLGLGRSGLAAARLALAEGDAVYASDAGDTPALRQAAAAVRESGGDAEVGGHSIQRLAACDLIVVSPGIPPTAPVLGEESLAGVARISELEFAYRRLRAPGIAITGTNGKSTTTALTAQVLRRCGFEAPAAGNIGRALSEVALEDPNPDWVVVEASSFQLADIRTFAPAIGVVTNLAPDHLDRYESVEAYYADKARIFENATPESRWILNGDDPEVLRLAGDAPGRRYLVRTRSRPKAGERGGYMSEDGGLVLRMEEEDREVVPQHEFPLLGRHNVANGLCAALSAALAGAAFEEIREALRHARPLRHRLQPVGESAGILWINDSKATNLASTRVALEGMTRPTVLLLGGRHKGEPYSGLLSELREHATAVVAFGEAAGRIEADLAEQVKVLRVDGPFERAVAAAAELARPGDAVLLSPACSSFDMFSDYEERGDRFIELAASHTGASRDA